MNFESTGASEFDALFQRMSHGQLTMMERTKLRTMAKSYLSLPMGISDDFRVRLEALLASLEGT